MKKLNVVLALLLMAGAVLADPVQGKLEALAKGRISGVTGIKKNSDGSVKSLLIIGRASLNKLLDADEAEQSAREDAGINASAAFSEYLNKNVTVSRRRSTMTATSSGGTEKDGATSSSASARTINVKSQEFSSLSKAAVAGMKEIYAGVHNNKYVIIYAWDKEECKQLKDVIITMSETAQTAIKEAKDAESRLKAPAGSYQAPVSSRSEEKKRRVRKPSTAKEGGSASADAGDYL